MTDIPILIGDVIIAINPNAKFIVRDEDVNNIKWLENTTPISAEDILAKKAELEASE